MLAVERFDNLANPVAIEYLRLVRRKYSGLQKVYGSRYLDALAKVCGYRVANDGKTLVLGPQYLTRKEFKSKKESGQYMESTIEALADLGIIK